MVFLFVCLFMLCGHVSPGRFFAHMNVKTIVSKLLRSFDVQNQNNEKAQMLYGLQLGKNIADLPMVFTALSVPLTQ